MLNLMQDQQVKTGLTVFLTVAVIYSLYEFSKVVKSAYKAADDAIDSVVDPIAYSFFSSEFYQGEGVELTPFNIERLWRDFFSENWTMLDEPYRVYSSVYPEEIAAILNADLTLKEEYRGLISDRLNP